MMRWPFVRRATYDAKCRQDEQRRVWNLELEKRLNAVTDEEARLHAQGVALDARLAELGTLAGRLGYLVEEQDRLLGGMQERVDASEAQFVTTLKEHAEAVLREHQYRALADQAEVLRVAAEARFDTLLAKFLELRLAGGDVAPPKPDPIVRKEPDPVTQAIIAKARGSRLLFKQFGEFAAEQRLQDVSETDIAAAIIAGIEDDQGVPG